MPEGVWTHVTGTYDGSKVRAYIDGELKGEGTASGAIKKTSHDVHIGVSTYAKSDGLTDALDEVAIFNQALSEDDINEIISKGLEKATGLSAVSLKGKLTTTWAEVRSGKP